MTLDCNLLWHWHWISIGIGDIIGNMTTHLVLLDNHDVPAVHQRFPEQWFGLNAFFQLIQCQAIITRSHLVEVLVKLQGDM